MLDENTVLRTNSRANVNVKFIFRPEFILPGTICLFRDGTCRGMCRINSTVPFTQDTFVQQFRSKTSKKRLNRKLAKITKIY
jgi:elongation factor 1-alpha